MLLFWKFRFYLMHLLFGHIVEYFFFSNLDSCCLISLSLSLSLRMNFLSNILREEGGFEYKKAIVDSIVILIRDIPDAKESGLLHLCEFIEDCEFTYLSTQVALYFIIICYTMSPWLFFFHLTSIKFHLI